MMFLLAITALLGAVAVTLFVPEWQTNGLAVPFGFVGILASILLSLVAALRKRFACDLLGPSRPLRDWSAVVALYFSGVIIGVLPEHAASAQALFIIFSVNFAAVNVIYFTLDLMMKLNADRLRKSAG
ncbi:hypothetical protein [Maricaulis alexandrii]|uniref:hypothetical protein n=1 Tax=Maricaulis alexandrii TaxID=2570354 RepID=UPI0011085025|nr:hypothetical protein [Maricaulis alexandrii]